VADALRRRFEGKVVLVTGAGSGIGRASVDRFAHEGASLFCVDVNGEAVEGAAKEAAARGAAAVARVCDVSRPEQVEAAVGECVARLGRLDALCNVAGILHMANTHEHTLADWERVLAVNLTGTFLMCRAALPHLLAARGAIVNVASTAGLRGMPWGAAYGASKGGVLALTRTLAVEYGKRGLRANAVCPGSIDTPMSAGARIPADADRDLLQRILPLDHARGPDSVAAMIALLASDDAAHINGEDVRVDGGMQA
jgi:NAD(P)-dependent dehydrogenase (short-subunit alcohol dehydrogenase family)